MTTQYSEEFKASIIAKLLPPNSVSVPDLVKETGIPRDTLYAWRSKSRPVQGSTGAGQGQQCGILRSEEKFAIVVETASLNELELGEYCRRKGFFPEQIAGWKKTFIQGSSSGASKSERAQLQQQAKMIKQLQGEINRKDRALAEAAALLVLGKKAQALWGESEDEKSTSQSAKK
jgi:transposase-like protein